VVAVSYKKTVSKTFHQLLPRLSLDIPPGCSLPRLHDLRHYPRLRTMLSAVLLAPPLAVLRMTC